MKKVLGIVGILALVGLAGCEMSSPRGGGLSSSDSFRIVVPHADSMVLQQGAVQTINLSLMRGDDFKRDVKIEVHADKGLSVDPTSFTVKASAQPDAMIHLTVAKDAPLGDYRVTLVGTPSAGEPTTAQFIVKVTTP